MISSALDESSARSCRSTADVRVDPVHGRLGGLGLGATDVGVGVDDLAMEVGQIDDVGVDDADRAHPGGCQVEQGRRSEATRADDEHPRRGEPLLTVTAHVGQQHVPGIARQLGPAERSTRLDQRIRRHAITVLLGMVTMTSSSREGRSQHRTAHEDPHA